MSREIKFRVWDKEECVFFKPIYEAYKGHLLDLSISLKGSLVRRTLLLSAEHESCFKDKYILNQFTGLKDCKGKDIYEGDIVKVNKDEVGSVNFSIGSFWVSFYQEPSKQNLSDFVKYNYDTDSYDIVEIEVLGNIYEKN